MCAMVFLLSVQWSSHRAIYLFGLARCYQRDWSQRASYSPGENATGGRPPVPGRQGGPFLLDDNYECNNLYLELVNVVHYIYSIVVL